MNCEECRESLPGLALGEDDAALQAHVANCPACESELRSLQQAFQALPAWKAAAPPAGLAQRTMERVQRESQPWWRRAWQRFDQALGRFGAHRPTLLSGFATVTITLLLLGHVLSPNLWRGRSEAGDIACQRNLQVLREGLERYAAGHGGRYPGQLRQLLPDTLRQLPQCPAGGQVKYEVTSDARKFSLTCSSGHEH